MTDAKFSFCETAFATGTSPWHIRELSEAGRKLGGGADTPTLCGREAAWDLGGKICWELRHILDWLSKDCAAEKQARDEASRVCFRCWERYLEKRREMMNYGPARAILEQAHD